MNALIDTNIVLDVLLRREPFFDDSLMVLHASEMRIFNGFVSGSSITDIFYIINRQLRDKAYSLALLKNLVTMFLIATVDDKVVRDALAIGWEDFEDSIQYIAGRNALVDYIVTRNPKDFMKSEITAVMPKDFLEIISPF